MNESVGAMGIFLIGFGTVFVGLICLIFITKLMSVLCGMKGKNAKASKSVPAAAAIPAAGAPAADRQAMVAAISASLAEVMGTDVTGLRIHSIKKVD